MLLSFSIAAITITFEKSTYFTYEDLIIVQPVLIFSNPSATDITVQVINTDVSTTSGNFTHTCVLCCNCLMFINACL